MTNLLSLILSLLVKEFSFNFFMFQEATEFFVSFFLLFKGCVAVLQPSWQRDLYANMPMHYAAIFKGCKNDNFYVKKNDIFLIFAQNKICGYTLEPLQ